MIRVIIADDHAIVREGLKQILSDFFDMEVSGEAATGDEALKIIRTNGWDVLLLDIAMPGKNVLELIKLVKLDTPNKPILVLSMYPEDQYAIRVLRAGADGYLCKESVPEQLVEAIRKLAQGGKFVSASLAEQLVRNLHETESKPLHSLLTDREYQVFLAIARGERLTEIAKAMSLSIKTVSTYRTRLLGKMKMSSNAEIIRYAIENRLLNEGKGQGKK
ncbi:MAG: response regulator transcription factor [Gammaproteobacteria bacterium]|nr:response regulator transcription factor [Gammaproteobacteria bacterium]